jgi:hypothetical protein
LPLDRQRLSIDERMQPGKQGYRNAQQEAQAYESQSHDQFRDATASPGHGFSFASDHKSVDILRLRNKLYRIVHIDPEPLGMSRAKTHKLVFRQIDGGETLRSRSTQMPSRRKDSECSSTP